MKTYSDIVTVCSRDQKLPSTEATWEKPSKRRKYSKAAVLSGLHEVSGAGVKEGNGSRWVKTTWIKWLITGRTYMIIYSMDWVCKLHTRGDTALSARDMHFWSCKSATTEPFCYHKNSFKISFAMPALNSCLISGNSCRKISPCWAISLHPTCAGRSQVTKSTGHPQEFWVSGRRCDTKLHFPAWSRVCPHCQAPLWTLWAVVTQTLLVENQARALHEQGLLGCTQRAGRKRGRSQEFWSTLSVAGFWRPSKYHPILMQMQHYLLDALLCDFTM